MHACVAQQETGVQQSLAPQGVFESLGIRCENFIHIKRGQPPKQFTKDGFLTLQQRLNIQHSLASVLQHA